MGIGELLGFFVVLGIGWFAGRLFERSKWQKATGQHRAE